jgi:hypothetical protein
LDSDAWIEDLPSRTLARTAKHTKSQEYLRQPKGPWNTVAPGNCRTAPGCTGKDPLPQSYQLRGTTSMKAMESDNRLKVSIKGRQIRVAADVIAGKTIVTKGNLLRIAQIKDDVCDDGLIDHETIIGELKSRRRADIFTFDQKLLETQPRFPYYFEWDNLAVLTINTYQDWWNNKIKNDARRMVRKAEKSGVTVRVVPFSDELIVGIKGIYDEAPIRQGKPFWHYNKNFETVKKENSTFLDRAEFIGAYYDHELIAFNKIFYTGDRADQIQLLSKLRHRDKSATNALIAKAIEVCADKRIRYLTYGKFSYGNKAGDSLSEFKERNGFEIFSFPRYYVPMTLVGKVAITLKLHQPLVKLLPPLVVERLLALRAKMYALKYRGTPGLE